MTVALPAGGPCIDGPFITRSRNEGTIDTRLDPIRPWGIGPSGFMLVVTSVLYQAADRDRSDVAGHRTGLRQGEADVDQ